MTEWVSIRDGMPKEHKENDYTVSDPVNIIYSVYYARCIPHLHYYMAIGQTKNGYWRYHNQTIGDSVLYWSEISELPVEISCYD